MGGLLPGRQYVERGVALLRLSITTDNWQRLSASTTAPLSLMARTANAKTG